MTFKITTTVTIDDQQVKYLLCNALEGGSNYWYTIDEFVNPEDKPTEFRHLDLPFMEGCALIFCDKEEGVWNEETQDYDYEKKFRLDRQAIEDGLNLMTQYGTPKGFHFANFINDNHDAETGDVFLQLCLFGEVLYG